MGIRVRAGLTGDVASIAAFQASMAMETENRRLDALTLKHGVQAVIDDAERGRYLVAEVDGDVVGSLLVTYEWSDWRDAWFWWVQSVYITPEYRRHGVFREMFRAVVRAAETSTDVCGVRLYVDRDNAAAKQVYTSVGMTGTGYEVYEIGLS